VFVGGVDAGDGWVAKFGASGVPDPSFGSGGVVAINSGGSSESITRIDFDLTSVGAVIVGVQLGPAFADEMELLRLTQAGALDTSFGSALDLGRVDVDFPVGDPSLVGIGVTDGDAIVAVGSIRSPIPGDQLQGDVVAKRFDPDGAFDPTYSESGVFLSDLPDSPSLESYDWIDTSFGSDGSVVLGGSTELSSDYDGHVFRIDENGFADISFGSGGLVSFNDPVLEREVFSVAVTPAGNVVAEIARDQPEFAMLGLDGALLAAYSGGILEGAEGAVTVDGLGRPLAIETSGATLTATRFLAEPASVVVPLSVTFSQVLGCEDEAAPDPVVCAGGGPDGNNFESSEFYLQVGFNNQPPIRIDLDDRSQATGDVLGDPIEGNEVVEFVTRTSDEPGNSVVPVRIELFDEDSNADDPIDINPTAGVLAVVLLVDTNDGTWEIEGVAGSSNRQYLRGNAGDTATVPEGGHPALVTFDVSILEPIPGMTNAKPGDADGDGLLDGWEQFGLEVVDITQPNPVTVDEASLVTYTVLDPAWVIAGPEVDTPDIFIENDWLSRLLAAPGGSALAIAPPNFNVLDGNNYGSIAESFAAAPTATNLWIDTGTLTTAGPTTDPKGNAVTPTSPEQGYDLGGGNRIRLDTGPMAGFQNVCTISDNNSRYDNDAFYAAKAANFDPNRRWVFRYALQGDSRIMGDLSADEDGRVNCGLGGQAELGGNDILNLRGDAVVMMHELGHNLSLGHGGDQFSSRFNCKPNYISVMNYSYERVQGIPLTDNAYLLDFSPARLPIAGGRTTLAPQLDENALDENVPIQAGNEDHFVLFNDGSGAEQMVPGSINPNYDPSTPVGDFSVVENINANPQVDSCADQTDLDVLVDHDDWAAITVGFRQSGESADGAISPSQDEGLIETDEQFAELQAATGRADVAVSLAGPTEVGGPGMLTVTATYEVLDKRLVVLPTIEITLTGAVEFATVPSVCVVTAPTVTCELADFLVHPTNNTPDPVTLDLPLTITGTTGEVTITAVATSEDNPVSNDPDPANNTAVHTTAVGNPIDPCDGLTPTHVGTAGDDVITGTSGDDIIVGLGGDDTIDGQSGNDIICGGAGNDTIDGGSGQDTIDGGQGNDELSGGSSADTITGGTGNDVIEGGSGPDVIDAGDGNNTIDGGSSGDAITAGAGNDAIDGGSGADMIDAGDGNNTVNANGGSDSVVTGSGADVINGGSGADIVTSGGGADQLTGGGGSDTFDAGPGDDTLVGGSGGDILDAGAGVDTIDGGSGTDTCLNGETVTSCEN